MDQDAFHAVVPAPFGAIGLRCDNEAVTDVALLTGRWTARPARSALASEAAREIEAYLDDPRQLFRIPVRPRGTPFQRRVWQALRAIPAGEKRRYGELAAELGTAARAIGGACRCNPTPLIVPCHRVVAAAGIGGFSGETEGRQLDVKRWLLAHERG